MFSVKYIFLTRFSRNWIFFLVIIIFLAVNETCHCFPMLRNSGLLFGQSTRITLCAVFFVHYACFLAVRIVLLFGKRKKLQAMSAISATTWILKTSRSLALKPISTRHVTCERLFLEALALYFGLGEHWEQSQSQSQSQKPIKASLEHILHGSACS